MHVFLMNIMRVLGVSVKRIFRYRLRLVESESPYQSSIYVSFLFEKAFPEVVFYTTCDSFEKSIMLLLFVVFSFQTKFGEPMYQRTDNLFAVIAMFSDKFKSAVRDIDKGMERKSSAS